MDISYLMNYVDLAVLGVCLCVGFVIKQSFDFIPNKYIPVIMLILGTILSIGVNLDNISIMVVLSGMISGLASTGLYEALRNIIDKNTKKK